MDLRALPKIDLHRHLEGSMRAETLWEFHQAQRQSMHVSREALTAATRVAPGAVPGFRAFLACFHGLRFKYGGVDEIARVAAEAVADAARDGVVHLELRFSPVFFAWRMLAPPPLGTFAPLPDERLAIHAAEAVVRGALRQAATCGISISFIVTLGRFASLEINRPAVELLTQKVGAELAALDLAGDEACSARAFAGFFKRWKDAGKGLTVHAGEDPEGPGAANVREAIEEFGADRIGHGVRAIEDPQLIDVLGRNGVALELCPTSNVQTRAVAALAAHPLKDFLHRGVRATINSDDPTISGTSLSAEFGVACMLGLSDAELRLCLRNAAQAAFVSDARRAELVRLCDAAG